MIVLKLETKIERVVDGWHYPPRVIESDEIVLEE